VASSQCRSTALSGMLRRSPRAGIPVRWTRMSKGIGGDGLCLQRSLGLGVGPALRPLAAARPGWPVGARRPSERVLQNRKRRRPTTQHMSGMFPYPPP
jgi:hypothetical protein